MRRNVIALTGALMMIALFVVSMLGHSQGQEKLKGDAAAGKELYAVHCLKCHAAEGQGNPRMYKLMKATLVHLGSKQAQEKSDAEIRKSMTGGFGKMEAITELTPEQIEHILAFTRTLKQ